MKAVEISEIPDIIDFYRCKCVYERAREFKPGSKGKLIKLMKKGGSLWPKHWV